MNWLESFAGDQDTPDQDNDTLQYLMESYYLIKSYQQKSGADSS